MAAEVSGISLAWYRAGRCRAHVLLTGDVVALGRSADNHLVVDAPGVSRQHARLERGPAGWALRDLGGRNGTTLNGVRVSTPVIVALGDRMRLGDQDLRFDGAAAARGMGTVRRAGALVGLLLLMATMHLAPGSAGIATPAAGSPDGGVVTSASPQNVTPDAHPRVVNRTNGGAGMAQPMADRQRAERQRRAERKRRQGLHAVEVNDPLAAIGHYRELYLLLDPDDPERAAIARRLAELQHASPPEPRRTETTP